MNRKIHLSFPRFIAGITLLLTLSSCALPPRAAWRKIRKDGLMAYWRYELDTPRRASKPYPHIKYQTRPVQTPSYLALQNPTSLYSPPRRTAPLPKPAANLATLPELPERPATLVATRVMGLPGFVHTPYTNPPRLVDVGDASPGTTLLCPFTHRPFMVPIDAVPLPKPTNYLAVTPPPSTPPVTTPVYRPSPAPTQTAGTLASNLQATPPQQSLDTAAASPSSSVESEFTPPPPPEPKTPPTSETNSQALAAASPPIATFSDLNFTNDPVQQLVASLPETSSAPPTQPSAPPNAQTHEATEPTSGLPYGTAIPGRPGFVNSPFAAKHQVVDVTGMPPGSKVQCPYTGKSFRVPQDAENVLQIEAPTSELASPLQKKP